MITSEISKFVSVRRVRSAHNCAYGVLDKLEAKRYHHVSVMLQKNRVLSVGWNKPYKTHPVCEQYGYEHGMHSENDCIFKAGEVDCSDVLIFNFLFRWRRLTNRWEWGTARPCDICQRFLVDHGIEKVLYTTDSGSVGIWRP